MENSSINYALEPNQYLEKMKNESDPIRKQMELKKYFTERITKSLYQNMDLLYTMRADSDQFRKTYSTVSKDLFINILLAVDTLSTNNDTIEKEYSICESYFDE
jgi:hypothetical protein